MFDCLFYLRCFAPFKFYRFFLHKSCGMTRARPIHIPKSHLKAFLTPVSNCEAKLLIDAGLNFSDGNAAYTVFTASTCCGLSTGAPFTFGIFCNELYTAVGLADVSKK